MTGYEKYSTFPKEYNNFFSGNPPDTVNEPDLINKAPYSIQSAIWFWNYRKAFTVIRNGGLNDVRKVTILVNGGTMGLKERQAAYITAEAAFK